MNYLWDFYKDGLTKSFIEKYLICKEQCKQEFLIGWTKIEEPLWFNFGNHIHYVLQHIYQEGKMPTDERIEELLLEYRVKRFGTDVTSERNYENQLVYEIGRAILKVYFFRFKDDFKLNWIKTEEIFKVPFEDTYLTGKFDGIALENGNEFKLFDHKCLSRISQEDIQVELAFDVQFNLYMYACKLYYGAVPNHFVYNIIRRPAVKPKPGETAQHFSDRIMLEVLKDIDYYFPRITIKIEPIELDNWINTQLKLIVADIRYWQAIGCPSFVSRAGLQMYGIRCQLFHLLTSGSTGGLRKKKVCFEELEV